LNGVIFMSNVGCAIYFSIQIHHDRELGYIADYRPDLCIPVKSEIISVRCGPVSKWLPVWIDVKNRTIVMNPFSVKSSKFSATIETEEIQIMSNQTCMCRSELQPVRLFDDCQVWETCILNIMMIDYFQRDYFSHYRTNLSFIITSIFAVVLAIITLPFSIRLYKESSSTYIELK
jgi:hypothetical protein